MGHNYKTNGTFFGKIYSVKNGLKHRIFKSFFVCVFLFFSSAD